MLFQNIIGYTLSAQSTKQIFAFDPAKMEQLPEVFFPATAAEVDMALEKAVSAWRIFRKMDPQRRAEFLIAIAEGLENLGDTLVSRMMLETAYPEARVLVERRRTVEQLRMFARYIVSDDWKNIVIEHAIPGRIPAPRPDLRKFNLAIGPVVVFAASNFPLAYSTIGGDSTSALAAGCPVIVKAHESHLGTNALVAEVIMEAARKTEMPDGVFSSLNGDGFETGKQLVLHPLTAAVGFTGSLSGGRSLFDLGNQREKPIPVFAEMGSVNPIFLLPGKVREDINVLTNKLVDSMTLTVGQFCTNPGIIVAMDNDDTKQLIELLAKALKNIPAATMLNENIAGNFYKGIAAVKNEYDVKFVRDPMLPQGQSAAPYLATVKADVFLKKPLLHQEIFGPYSLIVLTDNTDQLMQVGHAMEGQLTSTIHATEEEYELAKELLEILVEKAGRIVFNGVPTGVEVCAAMTHGGPYPASTDVRFTAVGHHAIRRWLRPVTYQNFPEDLLPDDLKD